MSDAKKINKPWSKWLTLLLIIAALAFVVVKLPRGFSEDLSVIGQGKNVVVVVHDKEGVQSMNLMSMVNKVRGEYADRIEFRVADANTREGLAFAEKHQASSASLILFARDGRRLGVVNGESGAQDQDALRRALDEALRF
ncbi:MAG: hypothetical protein HYX62_02000 [Gammaproteobacteria bacterium]|nr:hypothetical protein [Gammaproteobacteria bacterium]